MRGTGSRRRPPAVMSRGGQSGKGDRARLRTRLCLGLLLGGFALLAAQLYRIQVIDHQRYLDLARRQQVTYEVIPARRGTIYDRKFRKLALTREVESCFVSPVDVEDPSALAAPLGRLLRVDAQGLRVTIERHRERQFLSPEDGRDSGPHSGDDRDHVLHRRLLR